MNILNKFTVKNLMLNKKRTIVTIIGIMLSTALICGTTGLVSSFQKTLINSTKQQNGNYHTIFFNVAKENIKYITKNEKVDKYFITSEKGWAKLKDSQNEYKPYVHIMEYDKQALKNYGVILIEGRLPENSSEILIPEHIRTNARLDIKVGDTITLEVGRRVLTDGTELNEKNPLYTKEFEQDVQEDIIDTEVKTYKVVGRIERLNSENYSSPGYKVISYMDKMGDKVNISALYKNPKDYEEINENICKTIQTNDIEINADLLRFQGVMSDSVLNVLYTIAGVVIFIIVISSVFVIRNSFSISVSEKNRQYGMLASIGATSKQIKKNVLFEGFLIGLIAIPLGILLGIVAIIILLQVVNYLLGDMLDGIRFVYSLKLIPVLISVVVSFITIYLSTLIPAIRASKISPIDSIRGNNEIKIKARKIKTSKLTKKIFGIGGVLASKNLKRSKKKYRTTVISIVVSIFIFISLSSFLSIGTKISTLYYTDYNYDIWVSGGNEEQYKTIAKLQDIDDYSYYYESNAELDYNKYASEFGKEILPQENNIIGVTIVAYNNEYFKEYIKNIGIKEKDYKTVAILSDEMIKYNEDNKKEVKRLYNIKAQDIVEIELNNQKKNIEITKITDKNPMGLEGTHYTSGLIIVSQDFIKEVLNEEINKDENSISNLFIKSKNNAKVESNVIDLINQNADFAGVNVSNYVSMIAQQKRMILVISIFLYGFITVISLIGVTNIFNTISTNMILRSKEFAMLKSIGMTKKEFNKMIRLESIMYGLKALIIGIPLGIIGSYCMYKSFAMDIDIGYTLPYVAIAISIVFVFIITTMTMQYSLNKINKQNIIETIRKDNI